MMLHPSNRIQRIGGYEKGAYTYYPVLIVGAGESGIALGCRLKEVLGFDQFRIFERQSGPGGTWWANRYPGVACDIPTIFYSFSFAPNHNWSSFYSPGAEILRYFHNVCAKYGIFDKIQCNTDVSELRWLEEEQMWEATLLHMVPGTGDVSRKKREQMMAQHGRQSVYVAEEKVRAKIIGSCCGGLIEPTSSLDNIPGRESFQGALFHSAEWDDNVSFSGKDVVIVGTGCSAAQIAPRLSQSPYSAKSVTQVMRSPPWVLPKDEPPFGGNFWAKWTPPLFDLFPVIARLFRALLFLVGEVHFQTLVRTNSLGSGLRARYEGVARKHMKKVIPDEYHDIFSPNYSICCKRRIFDAEWLSSLQRPEVDLTTRSLTSIQAHSVTVGPGRTYPDSDVKTSKAPSDKRVLPADVVVLANGFETTVWLSSLKVTGRSGTDLHELWNERGGPQAYMGNAIDGFPNLFIIFGPNTVTGHSSVIFASECMVEYSLKFIRKILNGDVKTFEVKKAKEIEWANRMQSELKNTVFQQGGCNSWYKAANGWNATAYPRSQIDFYLRCRFPKWSDWDIRYTTKGELKHRLWQMLYLSIAVFLLYVGMMIRSSSLSLKDWQEQVTGSVCAGIIKTSAQLNTVIAHRFG